MTVFVGLTGFKEIILLLDSCIIDDILGDIVKEVAAVNVL